MANGEPKWFERLERLLGKKPRLASTGMRPARRVALGEHEAVALIPLGVGGVDVQVLEVEDGEYVDDAQGAAHVRAAGPGHDVDDRQAQLEGNVLKSLLF